MSNDIAVRVEGLGKKYRLGHTVDLQRTFRETLTGLPFDIARKLAAPFHKKSAPQTAQPAETAGHPHHSYPVEEDFWALRDVNFEIKHGETVGIIGRNGAGKSTLLKVLSRVVTPTAGRAEMRGRLASLLEVGTGFHPELTGRENIYLNGAILGMKKAEIDRKFDEIVDFAEVEQFLDTPVKRYSSGMYVRLAFGVAAHLEPEILIVDEVLAVGDIAFQKKCLGKMNDVASQGRTIFFVSHNLAAIRNMCNCGILLEKGCVRMIGNVPDVLTQYLGETQENRIRIFHENECPQGLNLKEVRVEGPIPFTTDHAIPVIIRFQITQPRQTIFTLSFWNSDECIFQSLSNHDPDLHGQTLGVGHYETRCIVPGNFLSPTNYTLSLCISSESYTDPHLIRDVLALEIHDGCFVRRDYLGGFMGPIRPLLHWETKTQI